MMRARRAEAEQRPQQEKDLMMRARKAESEQLPHFKSGTIVCDGSGGYRADLGDWAGQPCGMEASARGHEESHAKDWLGR